jgi:O-acetyl-ADP-ribose deacetylase (regulator of RNase III)
VVDSGESNRVGTCELGSAAAPAAGELSAKYIIHVPTVSYPVQRASLAHIEAGVRSALRLAESLGIKKIAFPLLGTGIAGLQVRPVVLVMLAVFEEFADLDIILAVHWQDDIILVRQLAERAA